MEKKPYKICLTLVTELSEEDVKRIEDYQNDEGEGITDLVELIIDEGKFEYWPTTDRPDNLLE